jgi:hypothetical protein
MAKLKLIFTLRLSCCVYANFSTAVRHNTQYQTIHNARCRFSDQLHKRNGNRLPPFASSHHNVVRGTDGPVKIKRWLFNVDVHLRCFITLMLRTFEANNCGTHLYMERAKR